MPRLTSYAVPRIVEQWPSAPYFGAEGYCSVSRSTAYEPEVLLWVASCRRTARRWWPPPGQWAAAPNLGARHTEREDSSREGRRPIGQSEGSAAVPSVGIGQEAGASGSDEVVSLGQVSPFSSAGIGRSRAGGENLDPVPEGVVAVESFEALQCPTFGPVHLVP